MPKHLKLTALRLRLLLVAPLAVLCAHAQETTTTTTTTGPTAPASTDQPPATSSNAAIVLNPFTVDATQEKGYFAPNTLAGTRLNTNIGDLPSSITVVTKQQLEDTNSQNINDVFRYESNTEGARTYTPFTTVRGNLTDSLGGAGGTAGAFTSAGATGNRIRGLAAADNEQDNYFSVYRVPFDSYNAQSIEIDRGPNSLIFGTGSPAGIVNESRISATLNRLSGEADFQVSSFGGYRQSVSLNIPLIQDKLAIYIAQLYNSVGFEQKPSSDLTRRQYAAFTFVPFKNHKTKITGSFENYNNTANDANYVTPLDYVTPWLASGQPIWNTTNDMVTYLSSGKTVGPYPLSTTYPNYVAGGGTQALLSTSTSPYFVPSLTFDSHTIEMYDQGVLQNTFKSGQNGFSIASPALATLTAAQALIMEDRISTSTNVPNPANYAIWYQPGVSSKSIYDWSTVNIDSVDNTATRNKTYNLDLQQELFKGLNLDVGWFRQEVQQIIDAPLNQANASQLLVDTNAYLENGAPNPHVGQPFLTTYQGDVFNVPEKNNNFRALLEYEYDFRDKPGILSWLGHHRIVGSFSQHDDITTTLRYRPSIVGGDPNYLPTATALAAVNGYSYPASSNAPEQWYYLGGATGAGPGVGTSSPGYLNRPGYGGPTAIPVQTYNYTTNAWQTSTINVNSVLFATGGLTENLQDQKAYYWQPYLWNDRIVGTLGISDDEVKNRNTVFPTSANAAALEYPNNATSPSTPNTSLWYDEGPWSYIGGNTSSEGFVVKPFKNWSRIDGAANGGNLLAGFLRTLGFTFNKAGNFNPPAAFYTDYFGNALGKPSGTEKDYGLEIATPDNKLFLRVTKWTNDSLNAITTFTSTTRANYIDATLLKDWATAVVEVRNGVLPSDPNFGNVSVYPVTPAEQTQISQLTGLPYNYGGNVGANGEYVNVNGTENGVGKGYDVELTYNPLPNWTMKFTFGKQNTSVSGAASQAAAWVNYRMPAWIAYTAADQSKVYTKADGTTMYLGNFWQGYGYDSNATSNNTSGYFNTQLYYNAVVGSQIAVDQANNGGAEPNQRQYSWNYLTNYTIDRGPLKDLGFGGDLSYDGTATAGYYGNTTNLNSTGQIAAPNILAPIYTPGRYHIDAWLSYRFKLPGFERVMTKVQFNVADLTSNGYLLPVSFNYDGTPAGERIIAPRQYSLSTKFTF